MITIIQVVLIVLLYNVYHTLSTLASCNTGTSCPVFCPSSQTISINSAWFYGEADFGVYGGEQRCDREVKSYVELLCGGSGSTFSVTYNNLGGNPCSFTPDEQYLEVDFDCNGPTSCSSGQDYPSCQPCGNNYY